MTKAEARAAGKAAGEKFGETFTHGQLLAGIDQAAGTIVEAARSAALGAGFRSVDSTMAAEFIDHFVHGARRVFYAHRNEIPEVKEQQRLEAFGWALDTMERMARDTVEQFKAKMENDPYSAFEWADQAMEAAAKLHVVAHLRLALNHPTEGGLEPALREAYQYAMQGARFPSRSTSQASNVMHQYKTAAYAEFVERKRSL